jgi:hypothetical protein
MGVRDIQLRSSFGLPDGQNDQIVMVKNIEIV